MKKEMLAIEGGQPTRTSPGQPDVSLEKKKKPRQYDSLIRPLKKAKPLDMEAKKNRPIAKSFANFLMMERQRDLLMLLIAVPMRYL